MLKKNNHINLNPDELERYARHLSLPEIGIEGQKNLKSSSILCVGSGGLGSPLLIYLAAAGVGKIGIVDFDLVEVSNLQRQIIHTTESIGKSKSKSAKETITALNPHCNVEIIETILTEQNALEIIRPFDIVCDCTDNFPSRYLINDACVLLDKPNIYGSIYKFEGQVTVFNLNKSSPNYRDLLPNPPPPGIIPSCEEGGVVGILPGLIGIIQATEVIKIITGIGTSLSGRLLTFNALTMRFKELKLMPCGGRESIKTLINYKQFCTGLNYPEKKEDDINIKEITAESIKILIKNNAQEISIIDVRNRDEFKSQSIPGAELIPLSEIESEKIIKKIKQLNTNRNLYFYCKTGKRSKEAIAKLKKFGINGINIKGGIESWNNHLNNIYQ